MIEQNKLPDKYLVKTNKDHPLWNKFTEYLIEKGHSGISFAFNYYGEFRDSLAYIDYTHNSFQDVTILTLEEWDSIVNPKFKIGDRVKIKKDSKWYTNSRNNPKNIEGTINNITNHNDLNIYVYWDNGGNNAYYVEDLELIDNMDNNTNQEIIGYKVKEEFLQVALKLYNYDSFTIMDGCNFKKDSNSAKSFKEAGVLDIWFTPVFKPKYQLPEINGYSGKLVDDGYIVYGNNCARFDPAFFKELYSIIISQDASGKGMSYGALQNRKIKSITLDSGVVITIDQIKQIVAYIDNNK